MSNESYFVNTQPTIYGVNTLQLAINDAVQPIEERSLADWNMKNPSYAQTLNLTQCSQVLVPNPTETNPNQAASIQYVLDHQGGGGSDLALNEINIAHPLTNNLDFSSSQYTVRSHDPIASNDVAIKSWTIDQIQNHYPSRIQALGNAQNNVQAFQNGIQSNLQNVAKELIGPTFTTDYQQRVYDQDYQIINENQLVTYKQAVQTADDKIDIERQQRIDADQVLSDNINQIKQTPLNQWFVPMSNPLENHTFEMSGNRITGMPGQVLNFTLGTDASSVQYVNDSVNQLATNVVGQIANVKTQCNSYTDIEVGNLSTDTQLKLDQKMNADTTLNEIPLAISQLNMNAHRIENLAVPTGSSNPDLCAIPKGYADQRYVLQTTPLNQITQPIGELAMNNQQIKGLLAGTDANDAINLDQFQEYTNTIAPDTYRSRLSSLNDIQNEEPANLNMGNYRISCQDPIGNQDVVTLGYFNTHSGPSGATDEIVNSSGFSRVKVNQNESISMISNESENLRIEPTLIVASQPIFSTSQPPGDVSNALLTKSQLDPYYKASDQIDDQIKNNNSAAIVSTNNDGSISMKANNGNTSLVVTATQGQNYQISNAAGTIQLNANIITLNGSSYTQTTTPLLSNSNAPTTQYQVLNRNQNDARYYQNTTTLNQIAQPTQDVQMNGFTLNNIRDAIDNLEPTNLAQVESLIANSGFKNKIQSTSGHAQVQCTNGSDNVTIKANNATTDLTITSDTINEYTIQNQGQLNINATNINFNNDLIQFIGNSGQGTVAVFGDLRSNSLDLNYPDQILTREQNDARYLSSQTTTLSTIPPPDASVNFGNQLLRNLQTPILGTDASTKAYIDNTLTNYPTTSVLQANYVSKTDAANTYRTEAQVQTQIEGNLQNYDTSLAVNDKISTALVPYSTTSQIASTYLTQTNAQNTYQPQSTPFTSIINGVNSIEAQTLNNGLKFYGGLSGVKTSILDVFHPQGQSSGTCEIQGKGRLNIVSNNGLTSIMSGVGQNVSTLTLKSTGDLANQIQYDNLVIGSRTNCPSLQLSSGHDASGNGYSLINNAVSIAANTLQLSPEISANVLAGNNLLMYANSVAVSIKNQFNKNVGLTFTQSAPQSNEFITKSYADATYTGGGIQSTIQDSSTNNRVVCSSSNVQIYTPLLTGQPSLIFKQSSSFSNYLEMNPSNVTGGLYISYPNIITQVAPTCFTDQTTAGNTQLIQKQYADARYYLNTTTLDSITAPTSNVSLNSNLITNLAPGTIASNNTSSVNGGDVYSYISQLPSVITQQVYTVTVFGSTTNGFQFSSLPNTPQNNVVQTQRVKGSGAQMITSSTVIAQSQTLVDSFASLQFQVSNANIRVTQVVPYTTSVFSTPGQQNIASLTFSQQAINASNTCVQLYKPVSNQGSAAFILYVYFDQF